jgi:protocatechuate 3,4-dioxygenase beta subunit
MRMQRFAFMVGIIVILIIGLFLSVAGTQTSRPLRLQAQDIDQDPPSTGQIRGRVYDDLGNPVNHAGVEYYYRWDEESPWYHGYGGFTDSDGRYEIVGLASGHYRVSFRDSHPARYPPLFYVNAPTVNTATDILLAENATVEGIDGHFQVVTGAIRGRVTDIVGQPLREITVYLYEDFDLDGHWERMGVTYYARTDDNGDYALEQLYDGAYRLEFFNLRPNAPPPNACMDKPYVDIFYGNTTVVDEAASVVVQQGAVVSGINAQLATTGRIQGKLETVDHQPLRQKLVWALSDESGSSAPQYCTLTDNDGRYELAAPEGRYSLRLGGCPLNSGGMPVTPLCPFEYYNDVDSLAQATSLTVHNGETITAIDARLAWPGHPPEARDDLIGMLQDLSTGRWIATTSVLANDRDGEFPPQVLTAQVLAQPAHGELALDASGYFTYAPGSAQVLSDTFQYQARKQQEEGFQLSNSAVVTFTIVTPKAYLPLVQR